METGHVLLRALQVNSPTILHEDVCWSVCWNRTRMSLLMELRESASFIAQSNTLPTTVQGGAILDARAHPTTLPTGKAGLVSMSVHKLTLPNSMQTTKQEPVFWTVQRPPTEAGLLTGIRLFACACPSVLACSFRIYRLVIVWLSVHGMLITLVSFRINHVYPNVTLFMKLTLKT
jgi:hypothetical protein